MSDWPSAEPAVSAIRAAALAVDGVDPLDEAAQLRLKHDGLLHARLWLAGTDGFALVRHGHLDLVVAPAARAHGVGRALAAEAAPHATDAWSHGDHPAAAALAHRFGWKRLRDLWVMRRPVSLGVPSAPLPSGVQIRSFRAGDEPAILAINAAAFAHHPEQGSMDAADLAARMAEPWFDPHGLLIAEVDGAPVGFHWTKQHDDRHGEVYVVGISPAGQGRGLGRALTLAGLEHLALKGIDEVLLYVDADNLPARSLYTSLGFRHSGPDTHVQWARN